MRQIRGFGRLVPAEQRAGVADVRVIDHDATARLVGAALDVTRVECLAVDLEFRPGTSRTIIWRAEPPQADRDRAAELLAGHTVQHAW
jgi:hypothetical protein